MADPSTTAYSIDSVINLFTTLDENIIKASVNAIKNLKTPLVALTGTLAIISIASNWEMYFSSNFNFGNIVTKIIHASFIIWLIKHWTSFTNMIREAAETIGSKAGNLDSIPTPDKLIADSYKTVFDYLGYILNDSSFGLSTFMIYLMAIVLIIILSYAFLKISWTLFMAKMEFYIMGALSMVLLPFSQTKWTKSMSEKTWGILLTTSVKLLVCVFMIAITKDFITQNFTITGDIEKKADAIKETLLPTLFSSTIAIFFLSHVISKVTEFAGAMANGVMIQSSNLVAAAGAAIENQITGGVKAAARHTGAAASKATIDTGKLAWQGIRHPMMSSRAVSGAATFAKNNPKAAAVIASKAAIRYMHSLHRAGSR